MTTAILEKERKDEKAPAIKQEPFLPAVFGGPFSFMRRFHEDMDKLFESVWGGKLTPSFWQEFPARWSPDLEVMEKNGQLLVRLDLPGLTKDDLKLEITEQGLAIEGDRKKEDEETRKGYYRTERLYGSFYRYVPLPEGVNIDTAKATFKNGVLEVMLELPKRDEQKARRLEIRTP